MENYLGNDIPVATYYNVCLTREINGFRGRQHTDYQRKATYPGIKTDSRTMLKALIIGHLSATAIHSLCLVLMLLTMPQGAKVYHPKI